MILNMLVLYRRSLVYKQRYGCGTDKRTDRQMDNTITYHCDKKVIGDKVNSHKPSCHGRSDSAKSLVHNVGPPLLQQDLKHRGQCLKVSRQSFKILYPNNSFLFVESA